MKKICKYCGKEFDTENVNKKCCSSICSHKYGAIKMIERNKGFKRQYNINDQFLKIESEYKYYFLGLMASDGCINKNKKTIIISQSGDNGLKLLQYLKEILNTNYKILETQPKRGQKVYSLNIRSKEIIEDLCINNIVPKKTESFTIPDYILQDFNKLKYFLIGYIDGDGSIGVYKNILVASFVCNKNMYKQISSLSLFKKSVKSEKDSVIEVRFNGKKAIEFLDILYKDIKVYKSYKYKKYEDYIKICLDISPKIKYYIIRKDIFSKLDSNQEIDYQEYIKKYNVGYNFIKKTVQDYMNIKKEVIK